MTEQPKVNRIEWSPIGTGRSLAGKVNGKRLFTIFPSMLPGGDFALTTNLPVKIRDEYSSGSEKDLEDVSERVLQLFVKNLGASFPE